MSNPHAAANAKLAKKAAADHKKRTGKESKVEAKSKQPPTKAEIAEAKNKLEVIAKEANARFEIAQKELTKSEDHCLAAAIRLKDAEELCKLTGQNFKAWCEKNITQKYDTARKYLGLAKQPDPQKALADLRTANAKRNKAHRAKKKAAAKAPTPRAKPDILAGYEAVKAAFLDLAPKFQMELLRWASNELGYKLVDTVAETAAPTKPAPVGVAADDGSDIPANLRSPRVRRTAPADAAAS